jgi:hypothetical protein
MGEAAEAEPEIVDDREMEPAPAPADEPRAD